MRLTQDIASQENLRPKAGPQQAVLAVPMGPSIKNLKVLILPLRFYGDMDPPTWQDFLVIRGAGIQSQEKRTSVWQKAPEFLISISLDFLFLVQPNILAEFFLGRFLLSAGRPFN